MSIHWRPGLFVALSQSVEYESTGVYHAQLWRSTDDLENIEEISSVLRIPDGPRRKREPGEWYGLYAWRNIVEMPDGGLLATIEGNFHSDRVAPVGARNRAEIHSEEPYKLRTSVVRSTDGGKSWDYISTVARPSEDDDAVGEGFAEPSFALLDNGDLFCIMRSGNYTPLYSARSTDGGNSWKDRSTPASSAASIPACSDWPTAACSAATACATPPARQEGQVIRARVQACSNSPSARTAAAEAGK